MYSHSHWSLLVPCTPQNVSAVKECGADAITMTWSNVFAIFYVATVKDSNGVLHSCQTMDLSCKIEGLMCSTNYTAYVIASNFLCNSADGEMVAIETGTACLSQWMSFRINRQEERCIVQIRLSAYQDLNFDTKNRYSIPLSIPFHTGKEKVTFVKVVNI